MVVVTRHRIPQVLARVLLPAAVLACAYGLAAPAAAPAITIGVAEQRPQFVTTQAFERTRLGRARILVGWNAVEVTWQRAELDRWFDAVHAAGVTPLVTFGKSRSSPDNIPTPGRYRLAINRFRARYPWVREFSTWNEANACG